MKKIKMMGSSLFLLVFNLQSPNIAFKLLNFFLLLFLLVKLEMLLVKYFNENSVFKRVFSTGVFKLVHARSRTITYYILFS